MNETVELLIKVGMPILAALVWLLRLEGRLNTHEQVCSERYDNLAEKHDDTNTKIDRMEDKLDRLVEDR